MKLEGRDLEEVVNRVSCFEDLHALDVPARDFFAPEPHTPLVPFERLAQLARPELDLHVNLSRLCLGLVSIHPWGEYYSDRLERDKGKVRGARRAGTSDVIVPLRGVAKVGGRPAFRSVRRHSVREGLRQVPVAKTDRPVPPPEVPLR